MSVAIPNVGVPAKYKDIVFIAIALVVLLILFKGFKFLDGIADVFGAGSKGHEADNKVDAMQAKNPENNPFSEQYLISRLKKSPKKSYLLFTGAAIKKYAEGVHAAIGFWSDETGNLPLFHNPKELKTIFDNFKHKTQVSQLADYFQKTYKTNILDYMQSKLHGDILNQGEMSKLLSSIIDYVNQLPE